MSWHTQKHRSHDKFQMVRQGLGARRDEQKTALLLLLSPIRPCETSQNQFKG